MCLIAFASNVHPRYRLALIANRDEFHARPTLPAQAHADAPGVFGGRDLEKGGSWLLVSQTGRLAAVTNVRAGLALEPAPRSRGALVDDFLTSPVSATGYLDRIVAQAAQFGRFNLLLGTVGALHFASNHPGYRQRAIAPGLHAISNGDIDAPWPKAERARAALAHWLASDAAAADSPVLEPLFAALADTAPAADEDLPDTGVGLELERFLSAPFIVGQEYGTRASTVLLIDQSQVLLCERRFGPGGIAAGESLLRFPLIMG